MPNTSIQLNKDLAISYYWTYGGSNYDDGWAITKDNSGNLYLAGTTKETGDNDVILIKVDSNGNQIWNKTWGGSGTELVKSVKLDSLGNIYLAGQTTSFGSGFTNMFILKYDSNGIKQWNYTWGHTNGSTPSASANDLLVQDSNSLYIVGSTNLKGTYDILVVKFDTNGVEQWNYTWGGSNSEYGYGITMDSNNGLFVVGATRNYGAGERDLVVIKLASTSPTYINHGLWGGTADDSGSAIINIGDGLYIAGRTESYGVGGTDIAILKYDINLNLQWTRTYGFTGTSNESGADLAYYSDSLLILGNANLTDIILLQYNINGDYLSQTKWFTNGDELAFGLTIDSSGNIYVIGTTDGLADPLSDIILLKFTTDYPTTSTQGIPAFEFEILVLVVLLPIIILFYLRKSLKSFKFK
ncbi:MAG: SBBP repeat-containing protein [Candidatus Helarchaeota archaeon]